MFLVVLNQMRHDKFIAVQQNTNKNRLKLKIIRGFHSGFYLKKYLTFQNFGRFYITKFYFLLAFELSNALQLSVSY